MTLCRVGFFIVWFLSVGMTLCQVPATKEADHCMWKAFGNHPVEDFRDIAAANSRLRRSRTIGG
jgi:hypothetical protein